MLEFLEKLGCLIYVEYLGTVMDQKLMTRTGGKRPRSFTSISDCGKEVYLLPSPDLALGPPNLRVWWVVTLNCSFLVASSLRVEERIPSFLKMCLWRGFLYIFQSLLVIVYYMF